jgi:hypothetical protein
MPQPLSALAHRRSRRQQACCREVAVDDNPDYVLHWYDHFYLPRACVGAQGSTGVVGVVR